MLYAVQLLLGDPHHRTPRPAMILLHAYEDIAPADIVEIVGKGTDRLVDLGWIPPTFKLDAVTLNALPIEEVFYVDG